MALCYSFLQFHQIYFQNFYYHKWHYIFHLTKSQVQQYLTYKHMPHAYQKMIYILDVLYLSEIIDFQILLVLNLFSNSFKKFNNFINAMHESSSVKPITS